MMYRAEQLNLEAIVETPSETTSDCGDTVTTWVPITEAWIGVSAESGRESVQADRTVATTGLVVRLRPIEGLKSGDRFVLKETGRILYLAEPPRDPDGSGGDWVVGVNEGDQD